MKVYISQVFKKFPRNISTQP